jgi:M6 family metalloprotease-like protein
VSRLPQIILIFLLFIFSTGNAFGIVRGVNKVHPNKRPKIHPYTHLLNSTPNRQKEASKALDNNKLLVILVDFQEEITDDPFTTGNGKFQLTTDPEYRTIIASPPHNKEYFVQNLEALRYYYLAVSQNEFNLAYDVYPQDMPAYTLPNTMSFYNPVGAGSDLFVERTELYFKQAFELADSLDTQIDFSQYDHFMIIHAGSDWQHDVFGDTPGDLPSFYIKVIPGKEAIVDDGNVLISNACNVPSTISQDFDTYDAGGVTYFTGYGALNGVMAHEFGHSLGAVDLYNVYNSQPMVGMFDIMDSGGSGITEDPDSPGVLIEGELPCLPGAFTRMMMFGESFRQRGLLKDVSELTNQYDLSDLLQISASSQKQEQAILNQNIIRIPLNEFEYVLIENRSVDPDNDGGTAIKGALGGRVALYPTPLESDIPVPTYEYDYLLPSFIDENYRAIGGGLMVWHVDNDLLHNQGQVGSDGLFVSNFDNNTVNFSYAHRGVRVIEADGLDDLGNEYSWFWTGTPFEYFHTYEPNLDGNGLFMSWTSDLWRPNLNAETIPPLVDYLNRPSFFGLKEISQPQAIMSYKISAGTFDNIYPLDVVDSLAKVFPVINSPLTENVLSACFDDSLHFYMYDTEVGINKWTEFINPIEILDNSMKHEPVLSDANNNGYREIVIPRENSYDMVEFNNDIPTIISSDLYLNGSPLYSFGKLFLPIRGEEKPESHNTIKTYLTQTIIGSNLAASDSTLVSLDHNYLTIFPPSLDAVYESYYLMEECGLYEPVIVQDSVSVEYSYFVISNAGNIYKCFRGNVTCIFRNNYPDHQLTNLAVSPIGEYSPCLVFAQKNKLYIINQDGTLIPGFPVYLENYEIKPLSHIKVRKDFNHVPGVALEIIYLTLLKGGLLALNSTGTINNFSSIIDTGSDTNNQTYFIPSEERMFWFFTNNDYSLMSAEITGITETPFIWSGFRNGGTGLIKLRYTIPPLTTEQFKAFVFPSPAKSNLVTLRLNDPDGTIKLHIYDIAGKLLFKNSYYTDPVAIKDIQLDITDFSSGVYIINAENNGQTRRVKFAVEK